MKLILVRHGETDWNQEQRNQGRTDVPLNANGQWQAERIAWALQQERIDAIYSSPLRRALETAQKIAQFHLTTVEPRDGLRELDQGVLEGLTPEELREQHPDLLAEWRSDPSDVVIPEGESLKQAQQRAWEVVEEAYEKYPQGIVVFVSHNLAIFSIICRAFKLELGSVHRVRHAVGAISILHIGDPANKLISFNDVCHLSTPVA